MLNVYIIKVNEDSAISGTRKSFEIYMFVESKKIGENGVLLEQSFIDAEDCKY